MAEESGVPGKKQLCPDKAHLIDKKDHESSESYK